MMRLLPYSLHLILCALALGVVAPLHAAPAKPNIIVILADDLGYADLGIQGSPDVQTPRIDSLAKNGVRFTDGYVSSPQCAPARAGLLTGRYQNRFSFESNEQAYNPGLPLDEPVIAEYLKQAGYATGMMGKWGVANRGPQHPPQRGFDVTYWNHDGNRYFPETTGEHATGVHDVRVRSGNNPGDELDDYSTNAYTREAVRFIKAHTAQPFFVYLPYITPHMPMEARPQDLARFPDVADPLRRTMLAMMANLDDNVGWILDTLEAESILENTLIFFISDNGGYAGNASQNLPFSGTKTQMLEGGIRIPFLVQWPAVVPQGKVYSRPVSSLDIMATSLAAAGVMPRADRPLDGTDLVPYLTGAQSGEPHDALYWRFYFPINKPDNHSWAIRRGDWKLVRNGWAQSPPALYNLDADPEERVNLIQEKPSIAAELQQQWERWNAKLPIIETVR